MPKFYARRRVSILAALTGLIASVALFNGPTASAALPTPVSGATARSYLAALTVAPEDRTGYNRDLFPHWITISGACNTRKTVLRRQFRRSGRRRRPCASRTPRRRSRRSRWWRPAG